MSDGLSYPPIGPGNTGGDDNAIFSQKFQHQPVGARVPERVRNGVLSTGQLILDTPKEFVVDFLQALSRPPQIVARVVMVPATMNEFIAALRENIGKYVERFGPLPILPIPPNPPRPTIQEIYEQFKLPEELWSGQYCNSVLIGHSAAEFSFDFITGFYPTAAVSARVFVAAPHVQRMLDAFTSAYQNYLRRRSTE
ncbi:MAG: DUF3467 domain-containing protein [Phycisphaerae bacterium]|nr:DUF3467 domain-containing protein [Phycisphaerae bacterium]MDW8261512.1 DUF3467 domain-containing protein [Phycisphaerales bacterium]